MNKMEILDFCKMTNCICGHDVSWHWMDMHKKGRCVYHIAEIDACHCEKFIKNKDQGKEMALEKGT